MSAAAESPTDVSPLVGKASGRLIGWKAGWPLVLLALVWLDLFRQLSFTWDTKEQYSYGWFVPLFSLYLFWMRWTDRPNRTPGTAHLGLSALAVLALVNYLPSRVIAEANPDWPLISYLVTLSVVGISLYLTLLAGGYAWVKHFAFPICFILVAVEWPWRIEHPLTQSLMQVVASLTIELLSVFSIAAVQHGNLIEISTGVLGIDDACSGIRSLQSSIMAALLFGEMYRCSWFRRGSLVAVGIVLAFAFNLVRALILAWQASHSGVVAVERWHDPAGYAIAVACFLSLWLISSLAGSRIVTTTGAEPSAIGTPVLGIGFRCWAVALVVLLGVKELWYRYREAGQANQPQWAVVLPEKLESFRSVSLTGREVQLLKHDKALTGSWREPDGAQWSAYFLRWNEGSTVSRIKARGHRPEVCLPASGRELTGTFGPTQIVINGLSIPFRRLSFADETTPAFVFFCLWEDGGSGALPPTETMSAAHRLSAAYEGKRRLGQQTLELILRGYPSLEKAEEALQTLLPGLIQVHSAAGSPNI